MELYCSPLSNFSVCLHRFSYSATSNYFEYRNNVCQFLSHKLLTNRRIQVLTEFKLRISAATWVGNNFCQFCTWFGVKNNLASNIIIKHYSEDWKFWLNPKQCKKKFSEALDSKSVQKTHRKLRSSIDIHSSFILFFREQ